MKHYVPNQMPDPYITLLAHTRMIITNAEAYNTEPWRFFFFIYSRDDFMVGRGGGGKQVPIGPNTKFD